MEDGRKVPVPLGKRLVYKADGTPLAMEVYDLDDGEHYIGHRPLASNPEAIPLERRHGEFYERAPNNRNAFSDGEWVRLHVKGPYEYTVHGRKVTLHRIYDTHAKVQGDTVEFTAYEITEEIHTLLMEKRSRGEVLFERPAKHPEGK